MLPSNVENVEDSQIIRELVPKKVTTDKFVDTVMRRVNEHEPRNDFSSPS